MLKDKKNKILSVYMKVMILNLPLLSIVLLRNLSGVQTSILSWFYIFSLLFGYYFLVEFLLIAPVLILIYFIRLSKWLAWIILSFFLYYLIIDSIVFSIYKFHINYFFIELFFIDFENFGFTPTMIFMGIGSLLLVFIIEYIILYFAMKLSNKLLLLIIPIVILAVSSQMIHIFAFENNRGEITSITPKMPLYFPITSNDLARKNKGLGSNMGLGANMLSENNNISTINYPKKNYIGQLSIDKDSMPNIVFIVLESWRFDMMDSLICPNIFRLSKRSTYMTKHFSTGNSTTSGIFGLFYGIHPTYWEAVKANSSAIDNPVLIDVLKQNQYSFGLFSHSNFKRFKLIATIFNNLEFHSKFEGRYDWQKDKNMNQNFNEFIETNKDNPFFGFIFYTSTHHAYSYPDSNKIFIPAGKINMGLVNSKTNPTPYINAYNSIHYVDNLVKDILVTLEKNNLDKNTIIVLTSDHGEEFNDNKENYWGHGSNFTKYQSSVPLIMFYPDKSPTIVSKPTSHIDIVPTILQEVFDLKDSISSYSSGKNIIDLDTVSRPFVVSSYVNHALIIEDDVYAVYPFSLKKYKVFGTRDRVEDTNAKLFRQAVDEMNWFYR